MKLAVFKRRTPPPYDSRPGSLNFLRSQSPGSLRVYFSKWVSYIPLAPGLRRNFRVPNVIFFIA